MMDRIFIRADELVSGNVPTGAGMFYNDYRDYRRMGWGRYRSLILAFWDLPILRNY